MTGTDTGFDTAKLESYLGDELGIDVTETEVIHEGLNLIIGISTGNKEEAYILRRANKLRSTSYMNELEREYRVMQRLQDTPIRAPTPVLFCDDDSIIGDSFFVMSYLEGDLITLDDDLPERFRDPGSRRRVGEALIDTLGEIHLLDVNRFDDVCKHLTLREQISLTTDELNKATEVTGHELPRLRYVADWLRENAPPETKTAFIHGDFRPGNVLFAGEHQPEITGVLDWETATISDPLIDLGYFLLRWRGENATRLSLDGLEDRYPNEDSIQDLKEMNEKGFSPFTSKPGSLTRRELIARYEEKTGITFESERFYRALGAFMLATVWEDLNRHQIESGGGPGWEPYVEYMSMTAKGIVTGEIEL